jgi:hypothetical protein
VLGWSVQLGCEAGVWCFWLIGGVVVQLGFGGQV